ncbi:MAG: TIGR03936 family radical SAM-associated protein [Butyrivibrio sp.]|nr:TIGR03936 family radical SAM-associated protein [Butyrivibrio sp.]
MHKLRLKFSKEGPIKFIGHLDVMRYFQKAIRRAEIDVKYSEGFSPHQVISFAQPLSVGATSDGEYMDMTVNSMTSTEDIMASLNAVMNEGIKITAVTELDERAEKAMTVCEAAYYRIKIRDCFKPDFNWAEKFAGYLSGDKLPAMKKTKSGEKEIDMKQMIFNYELHKDTEEAYLLLSMSSSQTLKPLLLFTEFYKSLGLELLSGALDIHRIDIYTSGSDKKGTYIEPFIPADDTKRIYLNA